MFKSRRLYLIPLCSPISFSLSLSLSLSSVLYSVLYSRTLLYAISAYSVYYCPAEPVAFFNPSTISILFYPLYLTSPSLLDLFLDTLV